MLRVITGVPELMKVALKVMAWCALGVVIMGTAFAVHDRETGSILLWLGMIVGYAGMATTLWFAYLRAEENGDLD
jgi:hypothetical protein